MNWRNLLAKNMMRNQRRYLSYLLTATLAVTVFAMFTGFVDNPAVQHGHVTRTASELLSVCRVFVALFALFFIFYFHAALIRARNKEFGLLLTLGMTPRQIGRFISAESVLIGLVASIAGIGLGIIGLYFFLLAMGTILAIPGTLPFAVPATMVSTTGIFFGIVFLLDASWVSLHITRRTPRMLLLGMRVQQKAPHTSRLLVLFSLICLGVAYDMALQFSHAILLTMVPILALTIIGTYFLFSQCSVMLLTRLRQPGISGIRLLIVARLAHRMSDFSRMLTVVTVLNAVVLTSLGAVFGVLNLVEVQTTRIEPFSVQLSVNELHPISLTPVQVQREIEKQHLTLQTMVNTPLITGTASSLGQTEQVSIMSLSNFVYLQEVERQAHPEIEQNKTNATALSSTQAHLYIPYPEPSPAFRQILLKVGAETLTLQVDVGNTRVLNQLHGETVGQGPSEYIVVVNDKQYAQLASRAAPDQHWQIYSYVLPDWQQSTAVIDALRQHLSNTQQTLLTDTVTANVDAEQFLSVMLFAGFFVGGLFFLAAGSAIYFKLFTQQEEDQRQFHALERIGIQRQEVSSILSREFLLLFFLPVAIGGIHSGVALLDLSFLFNDALAIRAVGNAFVIISLIYIVCFAIYFRVSCVNYMRRMQLAIT